MVYIAVMATADDSGIHTSNKMKVYKNYKSVVRDHFTSLMLFNFCVRN